MLPGAVLTRVAGSHLRVGSFQFARVNGETELLRRLADHAISRHYPDAAKAEQPYLALFDAVIAAQASLVAQWMLVGFVHGVMNTDNMTISGETIDYGPCAFMDAFNPGAVYSSIDAGGRYAYATSRSLPNGTSPGWPRRCCPCSMRTRSRRLRSQWTHWARSGSCTARPGPPG